MPVPEGTRVILALDIGNTHLSLGAFDGERSVEDDRVPVEDLEWLSHAWRSMRLARLGPFEAVLLASVRPQAEAPVAAWVLADLGARVRRPRVDFPVPLTVSLAAPEEVGVDRLLAAYAAFRRAGGAAIAVTFGTAITVNAVSADGEFLGGAIGPGVGLSAEALATRCALLPRVEAAPGRGAPSGPGTPRVIGDSTEAAIRSALTHGLAGMVDRLVAGAAREVGGSPAVYGTGGDAPLLAPLVPGMTVVPHLVLEGLVKAWIAAIAEA